MRRKIRETILDRLIKEVKDGSFNNYIRKRNKKEISSIKKSISSRYNQERVISLALALKESEEGINYRIKNVVEVMYKLLFKYEDYMKKRVESVLTERKFSTFCDTLNIEKYIENKRELYKELRKIAGLKSLKLSKNIKEDILIKFSWTKDLSNRREYELGYIYIRKRKFLRVFMSSRINAAITMFSIGSLLNEMMQIIIKNKR